MTILDKIITQKQIEVANAKERTPIKILEQSEFFNRSTFSFKKHLSDKSKVGIIAEFKRKSPSKGIINADADVQQTTAGYVNAGASALSILTVFEFFGGKIYPVNILKAFAPAFT